MKGDPRSYAVIGAAMEVHRELGAGFLEPVYQAALAVEFAIQDIPFVKESRVTIHYKGTPLPCTYRIDFLCFGDLLVETKAISRLTGADEAQLLNELRAARIDVGPLINFGARSLEYRRFTAEDLNRRRTSSNDEQSDIFLHESPPRNPAEPTPDYPTKEGGEAP